MTNARGLREGGDVYAIEVSSTSLLATLSGTSAGVRRAPPDAARRDTRRRMDLPPPPPSLDPDAWETVLDPVEQAFTVSMPRGWQNRAWLRRNGAMVREIATSTSPGGGTALFMGDPTLPMFCDPSVMMPLPGSVVRPYQSVEHVLPGYVQGRFGSSPGFRILGMAPFPELFHLLGERARRAGAAQVWITAGRLRFEYQEGGATVNAVLVAACVSFAPVWVIEVGGVCTDGDPDAYLPALLGLYATRAPTPAMHQRQMEERARSAANHQAVMAQLDQNAAMLRSNHASNMATLQGMAASHQAHMGSLHAAHDAQLAGWQATQAQNDGAHAAAMRAEDTGHRRFLNAIAEERTVVDPDGHTHQVADGFDRYFRRRSDGAWIGTRGDRDLSGLPGVDPSQFDEARIKV